MKYDNPLGLIGETPLVYWGRHAGAEVYLKLEGANPTGSLKDRTARKIVTDLKAAGALEGGRVLLDASSGSYACALAFVGRSLGNDVKVVVNSKISEENLAFLQVLGADVVRHGTVTGDGYKFCLELMAQEPDKYAFTDQLNNPSSPQAHFEGTGPEILRDLPDVAAVVASMGSGATLLGVSSYLKSQGSSASVIASVATAGDEKKIAGTYLDGVDYVSPFISRIRAEKLVDHEEPVLYRESMDMVRSAAAKGFLVGPQGGGVLIAALSSIEKLGINGPVVLIMGDTLLKNVSRFA